MAAAWRRLADQHDVTRAVSVGPAFASLQRTKACTARAGIVSPERRSLSLISQRAPERFLERVSQKGTTRFTEGPSLSVCAAWCQ